MNSAISVLLVDDEPNVLLTMKLVLEESGYEVITAASCAEALRVLEMGGRFDAVLTDLYMEEENIGLRVAAAAGKMQPRPIIMIFTGYGNLENAQAALHTRVDHFALKPLDLEDFKASLVRLLMIRQASEGRLNA
jgi:DNA-binding NtrC family response regulator